MPSLRVPSRFNGPPESANGGYTCGLMATALGARTAEVSLRSPPPLDTELELRRSDDGTLQAVDGETLVATARPLERLDLDVPAAATPSEAADAADRGYDRWSGRHPFPTCFVCGPLREQGDGMRIFPGELLAGGYAAAWTPHESLAESSGVVASELVWAALDCATSAPLANWGEGPPIVLARLEAQVDADVQAGRPHAVVSWLIDRDGRKRTGGAALLDEQGAVLGRSRALWIELRPE